jgi:hypothetical protein
MWAYGRLRPGLRSTAATIPNQPNASSSRKHYVTRRRPARRHGLESVGRGICSPRSTLRRAMSAALAQALLDELDDTALYRLTELLARAGRKPGFKVSRSVADTAPERPSLGQPIPLAKPPSPHILARGLPRFLWRITLKVSERVPITVDSRRTPLSGGYSYSNAKPPGFQTSPGGFCVLHAGYILTSRVVCGCVCLLLGAARSSRTRYGNARLVARALDPRGAHPWGAGRPPQRRTIDGGGS